MSDRVSRRTMALGMLALPALNGEAIARSATYERVFLARRNEAIDVRDMPRGGWRQFNLEGDPVFVHRLTRGEIRRRPHSVDLGEGPPKEWAVISGICTHASCSLIQGLGDNGSFLCPCHGSEFDIYGQVQKGPARQDLPTVAHMIQGGKLTFLQDEADIRG